MEGRRLKRSVVYTMYGVGLFLIIGAIYLIGINAGKSFKSEEEPLKYVSKSIFDNTVSVIKPVDTTNALMIKPYTASSVKIGKNFYSIDDKDTQENSIIYYENTYMQSSGVLYTDDNPFEVVAALDGTVTAVTEDDLLGLMVEITHDDGLVSLYQSLSEVKVKVNDIVKQGSVIAKSGTCNLFKDTKNGMYFEVSSDSKNINPNLCYDKTIKEIKG